MNTTTIHPTVLATFPSLSNPSKAHKVSLGKDGNVWCSCPSWRFQKNSPTNRSCKHIVLFKASAKGVHFATGNEPVAIRAPRRAVRKTAPVQVSLPLPVVETTVEEDFIPEYRPTAWEKILEDQTDFG
jgi:hypothetical protein